eukprot:7177376-Prymnesium_polylepis.2
MARNLRGWRVILAPPRHHLLKAMLLGELVLVLARQRARMLLIEPHVLAHGDPALVERREHQHRRSNSAAQQRGVHLVDQKPLCCKQPPRLAGLLNALVREIHIHPAGEDVR